MNLPRECPGQISWHYDRAEIITDGVVHAIGVCLGLIGAVTLVVMAVKIERIDVAPILVYVFGLITMLAFSAAYLASAIPSSNGCSRSAAFSIRSARSSMCGGACAFTTPSGIV